MVRYAVFRIPAIATFLLAGLLLLAAASCGLPKRARSMFGGQLPMRISIAPDANRNSPVAVELVIVYEGKLLDELLKMPAGDWFRKREQFLRDHPGGVDAWRWEWIPGQEVAEQELQVRVGAKGGVVFADYVTPGEHRMRIDPHQPVLLTLRTADFTLEGSR
jgi:type VI secretion system protein